MYTRFIFLLFTLKSQTYITRPHLVTPILASLLDILHVARRYNVILWGSIKTQYVREMESNPDDGISQQIQDNPSMVVEIKTTFYCIQ